MLKAEVIGYIGSDAEVRVINNVQYVTFNVAHNEVRKDDQGNKVSSVLWVSVMWKSDGGNLLQYLKKGQEVFVRGDISPRMYMSEDSIARVSLTLFSREIQLVGSQKSDEQTTQESASQEGLTPEAEKVANGIIQEGWSPNSQVDNIPY